MQPHKNDKQAQVRLLRKQLRRAQNHIPNQIMLDSMAEGALRAARDRIEFLEAEVARLQAPTKHYVQCHKHEGQQFTMMANVQGPLVRVCPNCELDIARNTIPAEPAASVAR